MAARPIAFEVHSIPLNVVDELAAYIRSTLGDQLKTHTSNIDTRISAANQAHKDTLQDAQSQLSNVIELTALQLVPVAEELKLAFEQIDLLEILVTQVSKNIKDLTSKLERTEQLARREERALNDGKHVDLWKGVDMGDPEQRNVFTAKEYFDHGRLVKRTS